MIEALACKFMGQVNALLSGSIQHGLAYLFDLFVLVPDLGSFLSLYLPLSVLLSLLLLTHFPLVFQGSIGLTVAPKLVDFAKLPDTLLMCGLQQLVQAPVAYKHVIRAKTKQLYCSAC